MHSKIPLPTDNVYKFYALFGLVLLIFGLASTLYVTKSTNEFMATAYVDLEDLKSQTTLKPRDEARKRILERQIEVAKKDKDFFLSGAAVVAAIGTVAMVVGFARWQLKIQPVQDEIADLQLAKLRHEAGQQNGDLSTVRRLASRRYPPS